MYPAEKQVLFAQTKKNMYLCKLFSLYFYDDYF